MNNDDERRKNPRGQGIPGMAVVLAQRRTGNFSIQNLSASGALLIGDLALAPGERVKVLLHVDGQRSLGVGAEVLRADVVSSERHLVAVAFFDVADEIQDRIQTIVLTALERHQIRSAPAVLVVDDRRETLSAVERDLHASGWTIISATTGTEVVRRLKDLSIRFEVALVELDLEGTNSSGVLSHLADEYPRIRRVLMSGRAPHAERDAELASGRAQVFLTKPWERQELMNALGASDETDRLVIRSD